MHQKIPKDWENLTASGRTVGSYVMKDSDTKLYEISKKHTAPSQHYALPVIFKIRTQMSCFCGLRNKHGTDRCDLNRKTYFGHEFICTNPNVGI